MKRKRKPASRRAASWELPPEFKPNAPVNRVIVHMDGEPRFLRLSKHANDKTLLGSDCVECCDCGLIHSYTYNVLRASNGQWYIIKRAYRVGGTGKQ